MGREIHKGPETVDNRLNLAMRTINLIQNRTRLVMMWQTFLMIIKMSEQWRNIPDVFILDTQQELKDLLERTSDDRTLIIFLIPYVFHI